MPSTAQIEQAGIAAGAKTVNALGIPIVGAVLSILGSQLAQHTARLADAASENQALDALIPAFDADLEEIVQAYNSGTDPNACITALVAVDTNAYNYLAKQVGKVGTAWGGPSTAAIGNGDNPTYSADCNKACTAGCCVYLNDLRPAIFGRNVTAGGPTAYAPYRIGANVNGIIPAIHAGGGVVKVIPIAAPPRTAYGDYTRAGYTLTLVKPPANKSLAAAVLSASGEGTSFAITAVPASNVGAAGGAIGAVTPAPGVFSTLTGNSSLAILAVVGGLILIITALFGQNALRVK